MVEVLAETARTARERRALSFSTVSFRPRFKPQYDAGIRKPFKGLGIYRSFGWNSEVWWSFIIRFIQSVGVEAIVNLFDASGWFGENALFRRGFAGVSFAAR
jgi:hypothetical protein